ncbi:MAG: efflux RND transporter permease subunit, partial [Prevotella sp.]|nr:efflux RND transporter permease subunit [Prevotella sp.]
MFQRIIQFSIKNKLAVGVFTLALIVWGIWSLTQLPFDSTPDITNNQVQVITQAPSLGAQEVEQFITTPVEMALANIPKVKERRSISRSGLSVITLVFDDNADTYWAREQVNQMLKEAEEQLPQGKASVNLGPIATGLGEIYHYTIRPKKGYEDKYTLTDLRTMQDWIVRKQLSGTPGVAEVSGWGGFVKQYEVAVDADRLNSFGLTVNDIYSALENGNENTGGSYIEKNSNQYFIRGIGLVKSLDDISKIPVKTVNGSPVLIRDVANVQYGSATRYGAVTRNGEGEVVAGISLMLKGENFQEVIRNVKERMAQIQKSLPEGVVIEPFIDRTQLVDRVTDTITRNLVEGFLIVVFILVLFLGNFRAGVVVASVIPLAMLFAFGMMKLFGVSGNLMSLGAIDFGLIVDGAVIIVEAVCHHIAISTTKYHGARLTQAQMDEEVYYSASRIRNSAAFGEIIIMMVYLPLLTLGGIEGKMFRPMALTIFFAILGAFILSLTYVPAASALFLSKKSVHKRNFSDRLIAKLQQWYRPVLNFALNWSKTLIAVMVILFGISVWIFTRMGGEFIPNLEEGDFAAEISMAQGTSLSQMVKATTLAEKIIKEQFPEVKQAVTRIGSSEIPTDPMPMERADMLISLKPKSEWISAKTKDELMEKMEEALSIIPGMEVEMSQPIQMRNNELITGIKQDVAIKIYGDDLDKLEASAKKIANLIKNVKGVSEPFVEEVQGLPQIQVKYNRDRLAQYGIPVSTANSILEAAFAGKSTGSVYEGDKSFDLVVRLDEKIRNDVSTLENLYLPLPDGGTVPLRQVADISFEGAPAQITHEDGQRRIFVGFNVRGRDVQSTVEEIQNILDNNLNLPSGYYYTYGGQFQNLKEATGRLSIALPLALIVILLLLYATLKNIPETLMVFSAIPLATIGGILALWMRGMPFSISAGVGFIALFGVAVLNGLVLIGQFNNLEKEGVSNIRKRVIMGCEERLRPVIMTALVASFGFLPMALSHGDGAEVQRPLATVVIGGLVTATILTLLVMPAIYTTFTKTKKSKKNE